MRGGRADAGGLGAALLTAGEGLPEARRDELRAVIRGFYGNEEGEVGEEALQEAAGLETRCVCVSS